MSIDVGLHCRARMPFAPREVLQMLMTHWKHWSERTRMALTSSGVHRLTKRTLLGLVGNNIGTSAHVHRRESVGAFKSSSVLGLTLSWSRVRCFSDSRAPETVPCGPSLHWALACPLAPDHRCWDKKNAMGQKKETGQNKQQVVGTK